MKGKILRKLAPDVSLPHTRKTLVCENERNNSNDLVGVFIVNENDAFLERAIHLPHLHTCLLSLDNKKMDTFLFFIYQVYPFIVKAGSPRDFFSWYCSTLGRPSRRLVIAKYPTRLISDSQSTLLTI